MAGIAGILRGPKKGNSTLGGLTRVFAYTVDQFTADTDFPVRADIESGELSEEWPLLSSPSDKGARIIFDIGEAEFDSAGKTTTTQFSYKHGLTGKVAGYEIEQGETVNEMSGKHFVLIAEKPNGKRVFLGTLFKPMMVTFSAKGGKKGDDYVGRDVKFEQTDVCDFEPPILATSFTLTSNTIPAYS